MQQDLEERYRQVAEDNQRRMENTIQMAYRCDEIGDQTLAMLAMDREKLMKVDQDLDFINDSLKRAEYHLHSMESWSGAIGNYFRGKPKAEKSGTFANKNRKIEVKAPECPPTVIRGKKLNDLKIQDALEDIKIHNFIDGEYIMYFCSNAGKIASNKKAIRDCVVMTNLGIFQVADGKRVGGTTGGVVLRSVSTAELVKGPMFGHDRVVITTWSGQKAELGFWNRKSSLFMTELLNQIPRKSREWAGPQTRGSSRRSGAFDEVSHRAQAARNGAQSMKSGSPMEGETAIQRMAREHDELFDGQLDELSSVLDNVAFKARALGDELKAQKELTEHIQTRVEDSHQRMRSNDKRGKRLLRR
eukprot:CAMPEP_0184489748 /NCGR_PEP_ID=MMETSP0113_2-20130426/16265_1 /TAXON_ID=91329 /ORGANISM="Norrisiella sphaerica, Strain BC52" /LENGTH=358 /DNA_ID=CAMNT_0026873343 /DNA_START=39 /DNA_END=1115 /DNA_ORIENTATION=-